MFSEDFQKLHSKTCWSLSLSLETGAHALISSLFNLQEVEMKAQKEKNRIVLLHAGSFWETTEDMTESTVRKANAVIKCL